MKFVRFLENFAFFPFSEIERVANLAIYAFERVAWVEKVAANYVSGTHQP